MGSGTVQFHPGYLEGWILRDGKFYHGKTMLEGADRLILFMGRVWRHRPEQTGQFQLRLRFRRQDEMTQVRRVEGPAKKSDTLMQQFPRHIKSITHLETSKTSLRQL